MKMATSFPLPCENHPQNLLSATKEVSKSEDDIVKISRGRHEDYLIGEGEDEKERMRKRGRVCV